MGDFGSGGLNDFRKWGLMEFFNKEISGLKDWETVVMGEWRIRELGD